MKLSDPLTTYRLADDSLIAGEYGWTTTPEFFDDEDEAVLVVREVWAKQSSELVWVHPTPCAHLCSTCGGDGEIEGDPCPSCFGDGDMTCERWDRENAPHNPPIADAGNGSGPEERAG